MPMAGVVLGQRAPVYVFDPLLRRRPVRFELERNSVEFRVEVMPNVELAPAESDCDLFLSEGI